MATYCLWSSIIMINLLFMIQHHHDQLTVYDEAVPVVLACRRYRLAPPASVAVPLAASVALAATRWIRG